MESINFCLALSLSVSTTSIYLSLLYYTPVEVSPGEAIVQGMNVGMKGSTPASGGKLPVTLDVSITFLPSSAPISGTGLWRLATYGSKNPNGDGEQIERLEQVLSADQQALPLTNRIDFTSQTEIDTDIGCGEFGYLCFEFAKGASPNPDFTFTSLQEADSSKFTLCNDASCQRGWW